MKRHLPLRIAGVVAAASSLLMLVLLVACQVEEEVEDTPAGQEASATAALPAAQGTNSATAAAACPRTWDLCSEPSINTATDLEAYIGNRRSLLTAMASSSPGRAVRAGVNLKRLLSQPELDALFAKYGLEWRNIWWEASNDVHGVIDPEEPHESLAAMEEYLKSVGDLGPDDKITGGHYFTLQETALSVLAELDHESGVLLVDIGPLDQRDAAIAELSRLNVHPVGACLSFCEGFSLWYQQKRIERAAE